MTKTSYIPSVRRGILLLAAFLLLTFPNASVFAQQKRLSDSPEFLMSNDIYFYDPSSTACVSPGVNYSTRMDLPTLVGNENAEKIWNFLTNEKQGLTKEQAAGVMGNIAQESGFNPDTEEGPDSAAKHDVRPVGYGIVQWTGGRRIELEKAANNQGVAPSDLGFQLAYMVQESQSRPVSKSVADLGYGVEGENEWETLKKQKTIEDATVFWHNNFEVSQDSPADVLAVRGKYAENAYISFKDMVTDGLPTSTSSTSSSECSPFAGGDLIQTLLAYAHPTNTDGEYPLNPEPKPAYLEVATRLEGEGKWVGGGTKEIDVAGIDCGGFVSLLLTQSGFEPDYNFGLDKSRGASNQEFGQQPWAEKYWTKLGQGGDINVSDLRPGDVAYSMGHTFIFVGQVDGFDSQYASASYSYSGKTVGKYPQTDSNGNGIFWRAPMAAGDWDGGGESVTSSLYTWYGRRDGSPRPYGSTSINESWDGR